MTLEVYKERSYARCIKDSYDFLAKNLWLVTKIMMPYYVLVALLLTLMNSVLLYVNVRTIANMEVEMSALLSVLVILPLLAVAIMFAQGRLFMMYRRIAGLTEHPSLWQMSLKGLVGCLLSPLFFTPVPYMFYAWVMKPKTEAGEEFTLKATARKGLQHWGRMLGVVLFSLFLFIVASLILCLPYVASVYTYFASIEGQVNFDDPIDIPTSGYIGMMLLCVMAYSLIFLFGVFFQTAVLLRYGDITVRKDAEKKTSDVPTATAQES